jgi:hypothetical protein
MLRIEKNNSLDITHLDKKLTLLDVEWVPFRIDKRIELACAEYNFKWCRTDLQ